MSQIFLIELKAETLYLSCHAAFVQRGISQIGFKSLSHSNPPANSMSSLLVYLVSKGRTVMLSKPKWSRGLRRKVQSFQITCQTDFVFNLSSSNIKSLSNQNQCQTFASLISKAQLILNDNKKLNALCSVFQYGNSQQPLAVFCSFPNSFFGPL